LFFASTARSVALVEPLEIVRKAFGGGFNKFLQRAAREIAVLVVDCLDARPIHRQEFASEQIEPLAKQRELAKQGFEGGSIIGAEIGAEIGDGLEVGLQRPHQPDHFNVAVACGFQAPARPHPVQIAVYVQLEQIARRVTGPSHRLRLNPLKTRF
jgi:hypothetical protein